MAIDAFASSALARAALASRNAAAPAASAESATVPSCSSGSGTADRTPAIQARNAVVWAALRAFQSRSSSLFSSSFARRSYSSARRVSAAP